MIQTRKDIAADKKRTGRCNCALSVLSTYADLTGLDEATARSLTSAFAAGMGNMEGTCGALVGAAMVLSRVNGSTAMAAMRQLMQQFQQRNGATQCRQLKGNGTGVALRPCADCVADACELMEPLLKIE